MVAEVRCLRADLLDGDQLDLVGLDGTLLGALERLLDRPLDRVVDLVAHGLLHTGGCGNGRRRLAVLAYPKAGQLARPAADASRAARVFDPTADGAIELEEDDIDEFRRTLALWPSGPAPDDGE